MFHKRNEFVGSFRGGHLEVLASGDAHRKRDWPAWRNDAERERQAKERRRDPAFHNRALFARAER